MKKVWHGNQALARRTLRVDQLRTHPRNARRGDIQAIAASLERFGQQRAALALPDGTIVAGNHTFMAARDVLGWTHFAVDTSDLEDAEVAAYLVADNRTSDLGTYDLPMLAALVEPFASNLTGLGFTAAEYEELIKTAAGAHVPDEKVEPPPKTDTIQTLFLAFPAEQYEQVTRFLGMVAREWETDLPETVLRLAKEQASKL